MNSAQRFRRSRPGKESAELGSILVRIFSDGQGNENQFSLPRTTAHQSRWFGRERKQFVVAQHTVSAAVRCRANHTDERCRSHDSISCEWLRANHNVGGQNLGVSSLKAL